MRILKIEKDLKNALQKACAKLGIKNVIIHRMNISKDIKHIRIFVSYLSNNFVLSENLKFVRILNKKIYLIKNEINKCMNFKYMPEILFEFDQHSARIDRIDKIFQELDEEKTNKEEDNTELE